MSKSVRDDPKRLQRLADAAGDEEPHYVSAARPPALAVGQRRRFVRRLYRVTVFKVLPDGGVYGGKSFVGDIDLVSRRLAEKFGWHALVRVVVPGKYSVAEGAAEVEVIR